MPNERIGERHLELLGAIDEVARHSHAGVSTIYQAAEKAGLDIVCKEADRREFGHLASDLEQAGYVDIQARTYMGLRASYSLTEEARRLLREEA